MTDPSPANSGLPPPLPHEEQLSLFREFQKSGDVALRNRLCELNLGLVRASAKRLASRGIESDDLVQEGCFGLIRAVEGFDPDHGAKFSTYATYLIQCEMLRALSEAGLIKVPRSVRENIQRVRKAHDSLMVELGRMPTAEEVAARAGIPVEDVQELLTDLHDYVSLDEPREGDGSDEQRTWEPAVPDWFVSHLAHNDFVDFVVRGMKGLKAQDQEILQMLYYMDVSVNEIANRLGWLDLP